MYFIFTPNKVFVQFQINDYLGDSADLLPPKTHETSKKAGKRTNKV